ncbi:MAG: YgeY family selenium metabolism-linked hydrolase [bacterium]
MIERIITKATSFRDQVTKILSELIQVKSLSGKEQLVLDKITQILDDLELRTYSYDQLGNLILKIGSGSQSIAFDAHIDTVDSGDLEQWKTEPFSGVVDSGFIHGRGAVDQKGGAAAMIAAAHIINQLKLYPQYTLFFTFTIMEEDCDGLCWNYLIEKHHLKPDFAVITEPTNLNVYIGHRGRMEIEVEFKGISAHASAPSRGRNAIYSACYNILDLEQLNNQLKSDPFLGSGSLAVTNIRSNSPSFCAIPDYAIIHLDRRLTSGETAQSALVEIEHVLKKNLKSDQYHVSIPQYLKPSYRGITYPHQKFFPSWITDMEHPLVEAAQQTYQQLFGYLPELGKWIFSTNGVALCGKHHIPTLGFGPGNEIYAHSPNEKIPQEDLVQASIFYSLLPHYLTQSTNQGTKTNET